MISYRNDGHYYYQNGLSQIFEYDMNFFFRSICSFPVDPSMGLFREVMS